MAQWKHHLDLIDLNEKYSDEEITVQEIAEKIATRLTTLYKEVQDTKDQKQIDTLPQLQECINYFVDISNDTSIYAKDRLVPAMDALYDWGDTRLDNNWNGNAMCWIAIN